MTSRLRPDLESQRDEYAPCTLQPPPHTQLESQRDAYAPSTLRMVDR